MLSEELITFTRRLNGADVAVPADGSLAAARALIALDKGGRERVQTALQATVVTRPEDTEPFNRLFGIFWGRVTGDSLCSSPGEAAQTPAPAPHDSLRIRAGKPRTRTESTMATRKRPRKIMA